MSLSPAVLYAGGQIPATATVLYTSPTNTTTIVTAATFTNTDTVARLLTVYIVRSGGSAGLPNALIDAQSIAIGKAYVSPELPGMTLAPGDQLVALADVASKITCAGINGYLSS